VAEGVVPGVAGFVARVTDATGRGLLTEGEGDEQAAPRTSASAASHRIGIRSFLRPPGMQRTFSYAVGAPLTNAGAAAIVKICDPTSPTI
jgi:hypothetical protein